MFVSLRHPHDVQKSSRFGRAKFVRNHDRSGLNHVLGRPYHHVDMLVPEGRFGDRLMKCTTGTTPETFLLCAGRADERTDATMFDGASLI